MKNLIKKLKKAAIVNKEKLVPKKARKNIKTNKGKRISAAKKNKEE